MKTLVCTKCRYDWKPRAESPKSCPRCKVRFDYNVWRKVR